MKQFLIIAALVLPFCTSLQAQNYYPDEEVANEALNRTLAIQTFNSDGEYGESLSKAFKDIFTKEWKLSDVEFMTAKEMEAAKTNKSSDYVFLSHSAMSLEIIERNLKALDRTVFTFSFFNFSLDLYDTKRPTNVTEIGFANEELTKIDFLYLCQQLHLLLKNSADGVASSDFYNIDENIEDLQKSTLLMPEQFFREKDIAKMDSYYENKYEILNPEKFEEAVLNKADDTCYIKIIWSNQHNAYTWITVDAADGSIRSLMSFGGVKFGRNHDANDIIKAKQLSNILKKFPQKVNSKY
ncbi:hypothetical protein [Fulvivirga sediminis]|uniref:Uncharacterized protein n=1 Tax=Fulvivirga sediminis TaxID=2803949 RepID=A0A937FAV6_9BACT|nr:hypothetical protein [Fulvivirga sediminis]MBL3658546.1 hypothetical protein [Fulvivirga sediminis]